MKIISNHKRLKNQCDKLWTEIIKLRAKYKSELSGFGKKHGTVIAAHHVFGKSTLALRYDTRNGICLEARKEHIYGVHSSDPSVSRYYQEKIEKYLIYREGIGIYMIYESLKRNINSDLKLIKINLEQELKNLKLGVF